MLFNQYLVDPNGFRPTFSKGLSPSAGNLKSYGSTGDDGATYQWLAKYCPAFAVLMTGNGLRLRKDHWGPIVRKEAIIEQAVDDFLIDVQAVVRRQI